MSITEFKKFENNTSANSNFLQHKHINNLDTDPSLAFLCSKFLLLVGRHTYSTDTDIRAISYSNIGRYIGLANLSV